jgi:hypothetical protein
MKNSTQTVHLKWMALQSGGDYTLLHDVLELLKYLLMRKGKRCPTEGGK